MERQIDNCEGDYMGNSQYFAQEHAKWSPRRYPGGRAA